MIVKLKLYLLLFVYCLIETFFNTAAFCEHIIKIEIDYDRVAGEVNPLIYGNSMLGDATYTTRSNYGTGIWDPIKKQSVSEVVRLARESGLSIARFPGGAHSALYNWKDTIGPVIKRPKHLYGLDEFLKTAEEIGCDVVYTLPYFTGTPQDAADLVEYLNAPQDGSNPGGGIDWAMERAKNGHPAPYGVKYFELGNEVDRGFEIRGFSAVSPEVYGNDYIRYREAMRVVDKTIKLGAVTVNSGWSSGRSPWNEKLFIKAGGAIDFLIEHTYFDWLSIVYSGKNSEVFFATALNTLSFMDDYYKKLSDHFESITGRRNIPLAVTEYNSGFKQDDPVPLRHTLGAALVNAGLLQIMMKPANNILMANYWQFVNDYWGMIKNDQFLKGTGTYIKRPNYYVFEMFHKHFGNELVAVTIHDINSSSALSGDNMLSNITWKTFPLSNEEININHDEVEVIFSGKRDTNFHHVYKKVGVKPNTTYEVSGQLRADGVIDNEGVGLQVMDGRGWGSTHSAVESERIWGTTKWVVVKTDYTTLSDASDIFIIVRRVGGQGTIKGKIYAKDIKLTEKKGTLPEGEKSVSVSASMSRDGNTLYLMVLNKNVKEEIKAIVSINNKSLGKVVDMWTLNAPTLLSTNEESSDNVTITASKVKVADQNNF